MKTTIDAVFTDILGGGPTDDGRMTRLNFLLEGGEEFAIQIPAGMAAKVMHVLAGEIGKAHTARTTSDHNYRESWYAVSVAAKPIEGLEFGYSREKNAVVLGVRQIDGTIVHLPIRQEAVAGVIRALQAASNIVRSGTKPRPWWRFW
jgi:hypothetical protein